MLQIRIYRTFTWECAVPVSEIRLGGRNPMELVAHDELQVALPIYGEGGLGGVRWVPVEIVEAEKPEHPQAVEDRKEMERFTAEIKKALA